MLRAQADVRRAVRGADVAVFWKITDRVVFYSFWTAEGLYICQFQANIPTSLLSGFVGRSILSRACRRTVLAVVRAVSGFLVMG